MKKLLFLLYGVISYGIFLGAALYAIGFVGNLFVDGSIDSPPQMPLAGAVLINVSLILLCMILYHVLTAIGWRRWIPQPLERSTLVLTYSLGLILLLGGWQPMGGILWQAEDTLLKTMLNIAYLGGWSIVLSSTVLLHHFELFGLRQVWLHYRSRPYNAQASPVAHLYTLVRHPLHVGFMAAGWAAPVMTITHLVLALFITGYALLSLQPGVRDYLTGFGQQYRRYRRWVAMLVPFLIHFTQRH